MNLFVKHGVRNTVRSRKLSSLFLIFLLLLSIAVTVGFYLTFSLHDFLMQCEEAYATVGVLEYMGDYYPDDTAEDEQIMSSFEECNQTFLQKPEGVISWEPTAQRFGQIEGLNRTDNNTFLQGQAVLVVYITNQKNGGTVAECLYSQNDQSNKIIYLNNSPVPLEQGHYYVVNGEFTNGNSSLTYFQIEALNNTIAESYGVDGSIENMVQDITNDEKKYEIPEDSIFAKIAETYQVLDNGVKVIGTCNLTLQQPFQQGHTVLTSGRSFTEEEYQTGGKVCVISDVVAEKMSVDVGDTISLSQATANDAPLQNCYWCEQGFESQDSYEVVGIFQRSDGINFNVYVPDTEENLAEYGHYSYTLGQIQFDNRTASDTVMELRENLPERVQLSIYDQGYAAISEPIWQLFQTILLICIFVILAGLAFLTLFGYLFVYRQRGVSRTMMNLGTGKKGVYLYFLSGSAVILGIAILIGTVLGAFLSDSLIAFVMDYVQKNETANYEFSDANLAAVKTILLESDVSKGWFVLVGILMLVCGLLFCTLFTRLSLIPRMKKTGRMEHMASHAHSRSLKGGAGTYARLSIQRGKVRALLPVLVLFLSTMLLCQLSGTLIQYEKQLISVDQDTIIEGHATSLQGNAIFNLTSISAVDANDLWESGYFSDIYITEYGKYAYLGKEEEQIELTDNSYMLETMSYQMMHGGDLVFANDLVHTKEFYYASSNPSVTYMEGYDENIFSVTYTGENNGIVSSDFLEENGLSFGDRISVAILSGSGEIYSISFKIIGSYEKVGGKDNMYLPLSIYCDVTYLTDPSEEIRRYLPRVMFSSMFFQLKDNTELDSCKEYLSESGYTGANEIGVLRKFITIGDSQYRSLKNGLSQRQEYLNVGFPAITLLLEVLAFCIPFMLIKVRRKEITTMRCLGASKRTVFFSIYLEQLFLSLFGTGLALIIWFACFKMINPEGVLFSLLSFVLWNISTMINIQKQNSSHVMRNLKDTE